MLKLTSDSFGWTQDARGFNLAVRTNLAKEIAERLNDGKTYTVEIKEYRRKRSLDANALYWSVLTQLAKVLDTSNAELHNILLRRYGQVEKYDDQLVYVVLPDTPDAAKKADCAETYHVKPTSQTRLGKDGKQYRTYILMRGSSTYDTAEMSRLIDGLLSECKDVGLDILTDREKELIGLA